MHHYLTFYTEDGKRYAEAWFQITLFGAAFCFFRVRKELRPEYFSKGRS